MVASLRRSRRWRAQYRVSRSGPRHAAHEGFETVPHPGSVTAVDNSLSPHGGRLIERIATAQEIRAKWPRGLRALPHLDVRDQLAYECVNIAYGFFSPLTGFMGHADVDAVVRHMTLASGYIWSMPIVLDLSQAAVDRLGVKPGDALLLTYQQQPLAVLEVEEIYAYDKTFLAQQIYGTTDPAHPGVARTAAYADRFLAGPLTLVNPPRINPPFDRFWLTPRQMRQAFAQRDWAAVAAFQTRNVPHSGHEWMMKGAWLAASADGVLVNAVIGAKKLGDYIDEAIVLAHERLREDGFFRQDVHMTSTLLWDMRYAGPKEAVFHALVRKNLGCTHHMFGRDHAGVGSYYDTYAAHRIFDNLPDLGIKSVLTLEWWYCPKCAGVAYEGLCGHQEHKQDLSGTLIRSIIQGGIEPAPLTLRAEVLQVVRACAATYGFGSPFVTEQYLRERAPVLSMPAMDAP
ncbi:MAG: sulfate adenylyltransferase [Candidatus Tectomicrobia bacterium]|uniref:sulfate adenylyltransferase n=1 Tax=Tectimicrobiota bacterium TaxID=2528274 RepID=A0A938B4P2_UNCTE|nr:sulfate adenylyltransferase [Candidatus Tectomicrobia bacterium]